MIKRTSLALLLVGISLAKIWAQEIETIQAEKNLYLVGDRTYSLFYVTDEGVIVIDPLDERHAAATMKAIKSVTDKPITHVFYSHNHWDHISGGKIFKDAGATFISHIEAKNNITPNDAVVPVDSTWEGSENSFSIGGKTLETYYFGPSHGAGMTVFRFPEHRAVFIIDLVVADRVLYAYLPDAKPKDWVESLEGIQQLKFNTVYMAHMRPVGSRADVTFMQNYFSDLYAEVDKKLHDGTPFFKIPYEVKLPQYEHLKNYEEWLPMNVWRIMMEKSIGQ